MSNEIIKIGKPGPKSKYTEEAWGLAKNLVENTEVSLREISEKTGIPISTIESRSSRYGWLSKRDITSSRRSEESLKRVTREISYQVGDLYQHSFAMLEAIQYSHRIKIERTLDGDLKYRNFEDWPDKPENWDDLTDDEKEAHRCYISVPRLRLFLEDLEKVTELKKSLLDFTAKISKGTLPKLDVEAIDLSRRDGEEMLLETGHIFEKKEKDPKNTAKIKLEDMIDNLIEDENE